MDIVYQALKNFLKAFVNLFAAIIDLFSGLINSLATLLIRICPKPGKTSIKDGTINREKADADTEIICRIRQELEEEIRDRDTCILVKAEVIMFENSVLKRIFAGKKKKLTNAVTKVLLDEEFKDFFLDEEKKEGNENRLPAICEVSKEAIS